MNTAVLGAKANPERYSYKALRMLEEKGHWAFPVHPALRKIEGRPVYRTLTDIPASIDTISVYLSATNSDRIADDILNCHPRRVIFNPGAENPALAERLQKKEITTLDACTLVMLTTDQF